MPDLWFVCFLPHRVQGDLGNAAMGTHRNVYNWVANSLMGGSRSPAQVKHFINHDLLGNGGQYARLSRRLFGADAEEASAAK